MRQEDTLENVIADSSEKVLKEGLDGASDKDVILMGFGWLGKRMMNNHLAMSRQLQKIIDNGNGMNGNNMSKIDKAKRVGTPAVAGGGVSVVLYTLLERFLS